MPPSPDASLYTGNYSVLYIRLRGKTRIISIDTDVGVFPCALYQLLGAGASLDLVFVVYRCLHPRGVVIIPVTVRYSRPQLNHLQSLLNFEFSSIRLTREYTRRHLLS
jgi:hypothetical protein